MPSALHAAGLRYRTNYRVAAECGKAISVDIAFPRLNIAVFVDGCFWHGCSKHRTIPTANRSYWEPKIRRNTERDIAATSALAHTGWTVVRIWEHEDVAVATDQLARLVASKRTTNSDA